MLSKNVTILWAFLLYGLIIMIIAFVAKTRTAKLSDYILGGRSLSGPITALGAGASDMSGWLLMALPGAVFLHGVSRVWMPFALALGAYLNWVLVAKRLRIYTEIANDSLTIPAFLANRYQGENKNIRLATALAIIVFFVSYSVAGFVAGAVLLQSTFGFAYFPSLVIFAGVIVAYTAIGGFLAVSWVDFFQGSLMFVALLIVPIIGIKESGGLGVATEKLLQLHPEHLSLLFNVKAVGILSLLAWGMGYFGQPHILVRFMAIRSVKELPVARNICMSWMIVALIGSIITGLVGTIYYQGSNLLDKPETVFIGLSQLLFNPWMAGVLLSAVLSAIMSTVSAQILMSASALAEDVYHSMLRKGASEEEYLWSNRVCVVLITVVAVGFASNSELTIIGSVAFSWCGLGASFGPVILFSLYWQKITRQGAIAGIIAGTVVVVLFELLHNYSIWWFGHENILPGFSIFPGFLLSSIAIVVVSRVTAKYGIGSQDQFALMVQKADMA